MGLCKPGDTPPRVIPKIGIVSPPVEQHALSQDVNSADSLDLVVRFISDGQPHRAIPLTAALCTAAAAKIPGSIVQQCVREIPVNDGVITIGHPSGRIQVNATMDDKGDVECCTVIRTARRISTFASHIYLLIQNKDSSSQCQETFFTHRSPLSQWLQKGPPTLMSNSTSSSS